MIIAVHRSLYNKNTFQQDAYRPIVDSIPQSAVPGGGGGAGPRGKLHLQQECIPAGCIPPAH